MLEDVRIQIEQLIARYEAVKAENNTLRQELLACKETGEAQRAKILELESEVSNLQLAQAFAALPPPQAKEMLSSMIKQIDKCITAMENS